jgi:protein gp37
MGKGTPIAWADNTFNPWIGCTNVSPGCDHCYAEIKWDRRFHRVEWGGPRSRTKWDAPITWDRKAAKAGVRERVFCASLADVFDNQVPDEWHNDLWALIDRCRSLDWLLLTKRPQNIAKMMPVRPPHVWLGITVENQVELERRWPILAALRATVRFINYEPALEPLVLGAARPDWVICGGESGFQARPFSIAWARSMRDQCAAAGIAFFMKQLGSKPDWPVTGRPDAGHDDPEEWPADLRIMQYPR